MARAECKAYINQLLRVFGKPPLPGYFKVKSFPHDFGSYMEVCIFYEILEIPDDASLDEEILHSKSEAYAYNVEANLPEYWDDEAKKELEAERNQAKGD